MAERATQKSRRSCALGATRLFRRLQLGCIDVLLDLPSFDVGSRTASSSITEPTRASTKQVEKQEQMRVAFLHPDLVRLV